MVMQKCLTGNYGAETAMFEVMEQSRQAQKLQTSLRRINGGCATQEGEVGRAMRVGVGE
jgi:hypothetical protein